MLYPLLCSHQRLLEHRRSLLQLLLVNCITACLEFGREVKIAVWLTWHDPPGSASTYQHGRSYLQGATTFPSISFLLALSLQYLDLCSTPKAVFQATACGRSLVALVALNLPSCWFQELECKSFGNFVPFSLHSHFRKDGSHGVS